MSAALWVQALVIALMVGWSAWFAAQRLLPVASRRMQARLIGLLDRPAVPDWLRTAAQRLQPRSTTGGSCGDGCSSCGGCAVADASAIRFAASGSTEAPKVEAIPLLFHPRSKR